ncbi:hypothetical protein [Amphibacillus cookii]|uniref:hypothetical protein n=1 Tax=Amphibacillus cookii TaxID=767787 RepID=UPI001956AF78|nr:hypothetical protein [Amphibacillus cookii]MBM7540994.1 archaellum component FlaC [Amphibacillus cookii]
MEEEMLNLLDKINHGMEEYKGTINVLKKDIHLRFNKIDDCLSEMDNRFNKVDDRFSEMDKHFNVIDGTINKLDKRLNVIDQRLNSIDAKLEVVDMKLDGIGNQFELITESRISEFGFVMEKVNKLEKELFLLKQKFED